VNDCQRASGQDQAAIGRLREHRDDALDLAGVVKIKYCRAPPGSGNIKVLI